MKYLVFIGFLSIMTALMCLVIKYPTTSVSCVIAAMLSGRLWQQYKDKYGGV